MNLGLFGGLPGALPLIGGPPVGLRYFTSGTSFRKTPGARRALIWAVGGGQGGQNSGSTAGAPGGRAVAWANIEREDVIPYLIGAGGNPSLGSGGNTTMGVNGSFIRAPGGASGVTARGENLLATDFGLFQSSAAGGGSGNPCGIGTPGGSGFLFVMEFS